MQRGKGQNNILVCSPSKKNRGQIYLVLVEELMNNYTMLFGILFSQQVRDHCCTYHSQKDFHF